MKIKEVGKIYETRDYDSFVKLKGNRTIKSLKELKPTLDNLGQMAPVVVNENMLVIDGQHRIEACRQLEIPVEFIIREGAGLKEVIACNAKQKNWNLQDYLQSGIDLGVEDYSMVQTESNNLLDYFRLNQIIFMFGTFKSRSIATTHFKEGVYQFDYKEQESNRKKARQVADILSIVRRDENNKQESNFSEILFKDLVTQPNYNHNQMKEQLDKAITSKSRKFFEFNKGDRASVIKGMSDIYNYRKKNKSGFQIKF